MSALNACGKYLKILTVIKEVIDELGTPEKVAQTIKEGLDINEQENEEVIHHYNERNTRILRGIIVVLLVLLILPTIGGVGGLVVAAFGLFLSIVCIGIFGTFGLLCALVALVVVAIKMFMDGSIAGGLICLGVGLLLFSLSYLNGMAIGYVSKSFPSSVCIFFSTSFNATKYPPFTFLRRRLFL